MIPLIGKQLRKVLGIGVLKKNVVAGTQVKGFRSGVPIMASRVLRGISRRDGSFGDIASDLEICHRCRYSLQSTDIHFQLLKFYPEGSSIFTGFDAALLVAGKPAGSLVCSTAHPVEHKLLGMATWSSDSIRNSPFLLDGNWELPCQIFGVHYGRIFGLTQNFQV